ncbi:predicted protein [Chaetomium globosum CBS 148.51]|uniref:Uncharacterized protein n=1 Tax=Chaetomium globosum (strain ATCC 6205 / CBS 148.51 / DSM 1962 / NBRC 6347 / NRRL 1970) TaxID=306901 RepID=Q2GU62_CHAGB|nr:uncharacterized protein CHGG_08492 [Chaetomium globosum CBS 148.51]EAQ84478.1 predicted protein [Chaetomium globosum CBS 148.51]
MDPNKIPNSNSWANSAALEDDIWNPDWDEFSADPLQDAEFAVSTTDDNIRFQYETAQSIQELNQTAPLPPTNDPTPDRVGYLPTSILDRTAWESNTEAEKRKDVYSTGVALVLPTQKWIPVEEEDLALKDPNTTTPQQANVKPTASRCAPCRFAGEVQDLLVALREKIDQVSQFSSGESLESLFGGNLHGTLLTAWSCAYWLTVLLNWDDNALYLNPLTVGLHGGIDLADAKNLVLELTYSVAHHVQVLIQELCYRAAVSMSGADKHHNPTTICCALWIVFAATHKFEKRNFAATSLANLRYSDVLEAKVPFLQNDELFQNGGTARLGLMVPRPTNSTWDNHVSGLGITPRTDRPLIPTTSTLDFSASTARNTTVHALRRNAMALRRSVAEAEARRSKRRASRSPSVSGMNRRAKTCPSDTV